MAGARTSAPQFGCDSKELAGLAPTEHATSLDYSEQMNRELKIAVALSAIVTALVLAVPALRDAFDTVALQNWQLVLCGGLALVPLTVAELAKFSERRRHPLADARR
jgi:Cation transporting ATPase, C-terminus